MRTSVDSELYISGAEVLLKGEFPKGRELFYISYMAVLAVITFIGFTPDVVIYIHFIAAVIAIFCTYQLARKLTENSFIALSAPLLYILWFKFQQWNLIVYTDALFSHMVVISIYALTQSKKPSSKAGAYVLILFTSFLRPTGLGLLFSVILYELSENLRANSFSSKQKIEVSMLSIGLLLISLNYILKDFIDSFINSYQAAEIIYPKIKLIIEKPEFLHIPEKNKQPLMRLMLFILYNPLYFFKISLVKGLLFLGHIKPYYSLMHNIFIGAFLYPLYFLALKGYLFMKNGSLKTLLISFIMFQLLIVSFTSENWDGRFLLPILPLIFILAANGISAYLQKDLLKDETFPR
ncbi:MAG: hypothetical protein AAF363_12185 [Bacteroidota bacterium]